MAVLTIDTSTQALAVSVGSGGATLLASVSLVPRGHSRLLQPLISDLLQRTNLTPSDLEAVAVGVGPGSYTGIRLGVTTAKALAVTLDIPVIPISTLAAFAEAACSGEVRRSTYVLPLLSARRGRAFGSIYVKTGLQWSCQVDTDVRSVSDWLDTLRTYLANDSHAESVVLHDFSGRQDTAATTSLETASTFADTIVRLENVAADIGPAMQRIAARRDFGCTPRNGEDVHALVPDYALRVEAEVKQTEGSSTDGPSRTLSS